MIPERKKTPEEIAALREGLGIPDAPPVPGAPRQRPAPQHSPLPPIDAGPAQPQPPQKTIEAAPAPVLDPVHPDAPPTMELREPVVHLGVTPAPISEKTPDPLPPKHSLRKHELALAPAPFVTHKTTLPTGRHDDKGIAEIRRRDARQNLSSTQTDPAAHLRKITAHPLLLIPAYLFAFAAGATAWQRVHHITPIALLAVAGAFALYIFIKKKRSRHHAAILAIIILMTLVFGGLHYAPVFNHAP